MRGTPHFAAGGKQRVVAVSFPPCGATGGGRCPPGFSCAVIVGFLNWHGHLEHLLTPTLQMEADLLAQTAEELGVAGGSSGKGPSRL